MKAVFIEQHGGPEVMRFGDQPEPALAAGQVLVEIAASGVNRADWGSRSRPGPGPTRFPHILGRDFAGTVIGVGEGADLAIGDRVAAVCGMGQEGGYAERIAIAASLTARLPDAIGFHDGAALALPGLTALVALEETLALQPGETILIQGGAGGVGHFAIQLARHLGAHVIATASTADLARVARAGAGRVIDYTQLDVSAVVSDCDAALDTAGGAVAARCYAVLRPGGRAAFIASGGQAPAPERRDVTGLRPQVGRARAYLDRVFALVAQGVVRPPPLMHVLPLAEAAEAHRLGAARTLTGKIVLDPRR